MNRMCMQYGFRLQGQVVLRVILLEYSIFYSSISTALQF